MKVLMVSQGRTIADQPDFDASFRRASSEGKKVEFLNLPYVNIVDERGSDALYAEIARINREFRPDLIFFQFFHKHTKQRMRSPVPCINELKAASNHPLIFGSLGDPFNVGWRAPLGTPAPRYTYELASVADAFFPTFMGDMRDCLIRHGARNIVFIPHAFCPEHFRLAMPTDDYTKEYDVVMLGSCCPRIAPRIYWSLVRSHVRMKTVSVLTNHFGKRFGLFGNGWSCVSARGRIPFKQQIDIYRAARCSVDVPPQINDMYYLSDRPFFIAGGGTPLVMKMLPRLDTMFKDREHAYFAKRISDFPKVCDEILATPEDVLVERRNATLELIRSRHMVDNRVDTIISVAEALRKCRDGKMSPENAVKAIRLWHFLPEVDLDVERKYAIANWVG